MPFLLLGDWAAAQLPPCPPTKLDFLSKRLSRFHETYEDLHETLLAEGWTFAALEGSGMASTTNLFLNGTFPDEEGGAAIDHFTRDWHPGDFFPWKDDVETFGYVKSTLHDADIFFDWKDIETYAHAIVQIPFSGNPEAQFYYGLASRAALRFWQMRIAMTLRNVFCFDNRGRPHH